jgi:hypothetical protein
MSVMETRRHTFAESIDAAYPSEVSVVCRYRHAFTFGPHDEDAEYKRALLTTSMREGAKIFPLLTYRGVELHVLDESSLMHTGTLKSIDGCIAAAKCKVRGDERVVFESGGNTGMALTEYGQKAGLETFCFVPEANLSLMDSRVFEPARAHLIAVSEPGLVKKATHLFGGLNGIRHIPEVPWRYEASRFRGCFILEHSMKHGGFDWLVQTISAAFGPIGIYSVLGRFSSGTDRVPRFLGIQQEANCPMYRAWTSRDRGIDAAPPDPVNGKDLLTKVMYDVAPQTYGTYEDMKDVLTATEGDLRTVSHSEFFALLDQRFGGKRLLDVLDENGVQIGIRHNEIVEKTGLIALAGAVKAIADNTIAPGSRVLCCLTSGTRAGDGRAAPEYRVSNLENMVRDCQGMIYGT